MNQERVFQTLLGPHISEKAAVVADENNQVVFRVAIDANKLEVKKAVEQLFNVKVAAVQTIKVKGKKKLNRFGEVKKPNWKKAIVRLAEGQEIDFTVVE